MSGGQWMTWDSTELGFQISFPSLLGHLSTRLKFNTINSMIETCWTSLVDNNLWGTSLEPWGISGSDSICPSGPLNHPVGGHSVVQNGAILLQWGRVVRTFCPTFPLWPFVGHCLAFGHFFPFRNNPWRKWPKNGTNSLIWLLKMLRSPLGLMSEICPGLGSVTCPGIHPLKSCCDYTACWCHVPVLNLISGNRRSQTRVSQSTVFPPS